jgi:hypothetical protein
MSRASVLVFRTELRLSSLLLAGVATLPGCASTGGAGGEAREVRGETATGSGATFVREVAPFAVLDEHGEPYAQPFLGGFNVPRPQFVDIDGDGDLDLFVQERSDALIFFENVGTPQSAEFVWRTDRFHDLSIGEWSRITDLDGDGDPDILAEQPYSYIRYYRNEGTATEPRFVLAADTVRDVEGRAVFADRQNIPNIADIDCDGRPDLFLGRIDGTIARYTLVPGGQVPRFEFVTERFQGIEIIGQVMGSARHGANAMAFADLDRDGDLDFFWGDYFEPGVLYIENTGGCPNPALRDEPRPVPGADSLLTSGYNVPVPVDIDGDGDLDLFIGVLGGAFNPNRTAANNFIYHENTGDRFILRTRRYLDGIDVGSESAPAFADIDGDGDLDLLVGNKIDPSRLEHPQRARLYVFENTGSASSPAFRLADTLDLAPSYHYTPAPGDLTGNGRTDLLLGTWNDGVLFFRNEGTGTAPEWVRDTTNVPAMPRGGNWTPALGDLDGDGDLDLVVGEASGELNLFMNEGTAGEPRFVLSEEGWLGIDVGRRSAPTLVDFDGDGDLDLLIGSEDGPLRLWRNVGDATNPRFEEDPSFTIGLHPMSVPAFADLNGDGRLDLIAGGMAGGLLYWQNRGR